MKAVRIHGFGDPSVLSFDEIEVPVARPQEVLVRVQAASVNPIDYKIRSGAFPTVTLPLVLGRDIAGVVEKRGSGVTQFNEGDAVMALLGQNQGGYTEYVTIHESACAKKPERLDFHQAAAVPLAALTAWQGLFDHGHLQARQRVLIHGGAGGVGHFAIQFAKVRGAWVCTTVAGEDVEEVRRLGADQAIDYKTQRFEDLVKDVDVVLDLIGGETQERSWPVLKRGGALISTVGQPSAEKARQRGAHQTFFFAQSNGAELREIGRMIEQRKVQPLVLATYPLNEVRAAHERAEKSHLRGKIVLLI